MGRGRDVERQRAEGRYYGRTTHREAPRRRPLPSPVETSVQQIQQDFQDLIAYVTGPDTRAATAYTVEHTLFRRLLALGAALLRLFFLTRAAAPHPATVRAPDGALLPYHDRRVRTYYSVFGKVGVTRPYFYAPGQEGCCPLDADLSLPERCYSALLQEWMTFGATDASYNESRHLLASILGLRLSTQALETSAAAQATDTQAFYAQPRTVASSPQATLLVVQADGKGVPLVQPPLETPVLRRGKGQPRTKKKEALVTSVYTIAPYRRTPQEVVAALFQDRPPEPRRRATPVPVRVQRPVPVGKEVRATLDGKEAALARLAQRTSLHDGPHIQERVALTDGANALQERMRAQFPTHTLVLDIIHAADYLWDAATALWGETHPARPAWVRAGLEQVLSGQTADVIAALEQTAEEKGRTATQCVALHRTAGYFRRNLPFMQYDAYLARGWPIGTGVIEGACRHVVKDRMEQTGMRWTLTGAQVILDLRALRLNGQWDAYGQFHRQCAHQRQYGTPLPHEDTPEAQVLARAA